MRVVWAALWCVVVVAVTARGQFVEVASTAVGEELASGYTVTTSHDVELPRDLSNGEQTVAILFQGVAVPAFSLVTHCSLAFTALEDSVPTEGPSLTLEIRAERSTAPSAPQASSTFDVTTRHTTYKRVEWQPGQWSAQGVYETPDLAPVLQELVAQLAWDGRVVFVLGRSATDQGWDTRVAFHVGDNGPVLRLGYSTLGLSAAVVPLSGFAEEVVASGQTSISSSDLELSRDTDGPQLVGLRFALLSVPPHDRVVYAAVQFACDEVSAAATAVRIRAQHGDPLPPPLSADTFNVSTRALGDVEVVWQPPAWSVVGEAGMRQQTPDLSELIAEQLEQWDGDGRVVLVLDEAPGSVTGVRWAGVEPTLVVVFALNPSPSPSRSFTASTSWSPSPSPSASASPAFATGAVEDGGASDDSKGGLFASRTLVVVALGGCAVVVLVSIAVCVRSRGRKQVPQGEVYSGPAEVYARSSYGVGNYGEQRRVNNREMLARDLRRAQIDPNDPGVYV